MSGVGGNPRKRRLSFRSEDDVLAEVERLQKGDHTKLANWSLPMICWHLSLAGEPMPPSSTTPTPEQDAMRKGLIDVILETGAPPPGFEAPPEMTPSADSTDTDVERFKSALRASKAFAHTHVDFGSFGPVPIERARRLLLMHSAHHLGFLIPAQMPGKPSRRENLRYADEDAVIDEVKKLRRGYEQAGSWSLPQMCYHLDKAVQARMHPGPFPPNTPEQDARRDVVRQVLATGKLPPGIQAPDPMLPPADMSDEAIEAFLATMEKFKHFPGPIAPHRLFGHLSDPDARRLNLIHCAHHLSYLTPK
ncbi:MAG: DUF1569 domain-containing protein [Tepidisphaeraceae bacterium]